MASLSSASCRSTISFDCAGETIAASSNSTLSAPPPRFWDLLTSGVINNDLAHRSGGYGEEVGAVLPARIGLIGQAQISLVDQRRSLQCVIGTLPAHMTMSDASKFLIDQRSQFREGSIVPVTPSRQETGHFLLRNRGRIHNRSFTAYQPAKHLLHAAKRLSERRHELHEFSRIEYGQHNLGH